MAPLKKESLLADSHYVTLILRLHLDEMGELNQSELVDTVGSLPKRFIDRKGLHQGIDDWLNKFSQSLSKLNQSESKELQTQKREGKLG